MDEFVDVRPTRPGGKEIRRGGQFLELSPGDAVEGFLLAPIKVQNQRGELVDRWQLLTKGAQEPLILPNHYDLDVKLREVWESTGEASWVWIGYLGKKRVAGVPSPMAFYRVVNYGKEGIADEPSS